jgi:hypothetical protein
VAHEVEHLPSKCEGQSSKSSTAKEKKQLKIKDHVEATHPHLYPLVKQQVSWGNIIVSKTFK